MKSVEVINTYKIFTKEFQDCNVEEVVEEIKENGFFVFKNAITHEAISKIERDATELKLGLNHNEINGVYFEKQYYFTNLLTKSKTFYNFVTSKFVLDVSEKYLGNTFRLKALRYYETYGKHQMQWHTDNKTDKSFAHIPGIIFIFYISDVEDGQFQYIRGSHNWSGEKAYSEYSEEFVNKNFKEKVKNFKLPKGSLIIYNTYGVHRAKPVQKNNFVRKSVFLQVDSKIDNAEPIIVNTKYIQEINNKISMFLGFGQPSNYKVFPKTSLNTLPLNKNLIFNIIKYFSYRFIRNIFDLLPKFLKKIIKRQIKND